MVTSSCPVPAVAEEGRGAAHTTALDAWVHRQLARASLGLSPIALSLAFCDWSSHMGVSPGRLYALAVLAAQQAQRWWQQQGDSLLGQPQEPIALSPGDERFSHPSWERWPRPGPRAPAG